MDFLSINIETTGLDPAKDHVLQLVAVPFRTSDAGGRLWWGEQDISFEALVVPKEPVSASLQVLSMHSNLWKRMHGAEMELERVKSMEDSNHFIQREIIGGRTIVICHKDKLFLLFSRWLEKNYPKSINAAKFNVCGKNFGMFDYQFLLKCDERFKGLFKRRFLDPAQWFVRLEDDELPSMDECIIRVEPKFSEYMSPQPSVFDCLWVARATGWLFVLGHYSQAYKAEKAKKAKRKKRK